MEEEAKAKARAPPSQRIWIAIVAILLVVVVVLAAILAGPLLFPAEPNPIIGTVLPQTGLLEIFGVSMVVAANMAVAHINEGGGVLGKNLVIIHEDSATAAATGVTAARKLVDVDGAQALVGAAASAVSRPMMESVALPSRIVQISPASTSPVFTDAMAGVENPGDRFFFRTAPSDALQGPVGATHAYETLGWRNAGILHLDDPYGAGLAGAFEDKFVRLGGTIAAKVAYNPEAVSFTSELQTVFAANPDGIYLVAFPGEGEILLGDWWANTAWHDIEWLGTDGTTSQTFIDILMDKDIDVRGFQGTNPIASLAVEDSAARFVDLFADATLGLREPQTFDGNTYDAVFLIALAMQAGGSARSESIRANLHRVANPPGEVVSIGPDGWARALELLAAGQDINYEGASGSANFDEFGDVGSDYEIWEVGDDGQMFRVKRVQEADIELSPPAPGLFVSPGAAAGIFQPEAAAVSRT